VLITAKGLRQAVQARDLNGDGDADICVRNWDGIRCALSP
jgi:hypothetical protein